MLLEGRVRKASEISNSSDRPKIGRPRKIPKVEPESTTTTALKRGKGRHELDIKVEDDRKKGLRARQKSAHYT